MTPSTLFPFIVGKYVWFRVCIDLALIAFLCGVMFSKELSVITDRFLILFRHPLVIAVSVFTLMFLLACFFGVDPHFSFWSNFERGEGGIQVIHLYIFFLLLTYLFQEEKDWRKIFGFVFFGAIFMSVYGVFAGLGTRGFIGAPFTDQGFRFQGSIGNSAYVAAYILFSLFYAGYIILSRYRNKLFSFVPIILYILSGGLLTVFIFAATRGALLGLIGALCVSGFYMAFRHSMARKWILGALAAVLIVFGTGIYFKQSVFIQKLPMARLFDISFTTETFGHRAIMWKSAIDGFKERPLLGWGPENFIHVFDAHFNTAYFKPSEGFGAWFDRAHSIIFDSLAETGILGLLSFLSMFGVFFFLFFRHHHISSVFSSYSSTVKAIILCIPVAYLIQGLVLFDVLPIYTNVFLFLAFATYLFSAPHFKLQTSNNK